MGVIIKVFIALLLLFNGMGAIYGGGNLILQPDGSSIQLSMDWLKYTPFQDYLVPGIILFISNGVFSIFVLTTMLLESKNYSWLVIAQGAILTGWIAVQILMIQTVYFLHLIMGSVGLLLICLGWLTLKIQKSLLDATRQIL